MLDAVRIRVLNALLKDSQQPRKGLAVSLKVSESYVSKLIKDLTEYDKYIGKFSIEIDYDKVGYSTHALTFIKLSKDSMADINSVAEKISALDDAIEVFTVFGGWDIWVRWLCRTPSAIMSNIDNVLHASHIERTETITLGRAYKRAFGPPVSLPK